MDRFAFFSPLPRSEPGGSTFTSARLSTNFNHTEARLAFEPGSTVSGDVIFDGPGFSRALRTPGRISKAAPPGQSD